MAAPVGCFLAGALSAAFAATATGSAAAATAASVKRRHDGWVQSNGVKGYRPPLNPADADAGRLLSFLSASSVPTFLLVFLSVFFS